MFKWSFSTVRWLVVVCGTVTVLAVVVCLHRFDLRQDTADTILKRADDLAWKNRWLDAQPLYAKAQRLYVKESRPSQALYAQVSQFIPRAESEDISSLLLELQQDQSLPAAQEPATELRILTIQGMIETNYDASMASKTWKRVQVLAEQQHQYRLIMRAVGEQGIAAFLLGDLTTAKKLVVRAWLSAKYLGDPAAQVRYASVYGAGLVALHRYQEAISALNEAIATSSHARGLAYPSIAINSKIDALRGLHRYREALALADEAIARLPMSRLDAHLFQLLTSKGEIYEDMGRWRDAELQYALALDYARYLDYWRGITQTGGLLARVYEQLYFLNGTERGVLLDTGCAPDPARLIFPYLREIGLAASDIDIVINTHCDLDHCGGNHAVKTANPQAQITCGEADRPLIENPKTMWDLRYNAYEAEHGIHYDEAGREAIFASLGSSQTVDWTWIGGETLDLGRGWRIEIHRTPGHSRGHLAIFDPRSGTMLTGDAVQGSVYLDKDGAPALCPTYLQVNSYLKTISYLESLPIKLLAGCHWPLKREGEVREFLMESREFVERADELILAQLACCPHGGSLRELIDGIGPRLGSWPAAANRELVYALAGHLEHLVCAGKITILSCNPPLRYQVGK